MPPTSSQRTWTADACLWIGFGLTALGVGLWSIPAGCIVAGVTLFIAGLRATQ